MTDRAHAVPIRVGDGRASTPSPMVTTGFMQPPPPAAKQIRPLEEVFLDALPTVERIVAAHRRRHGLSHADGEDLLAWVRLRLIEHEYAILAKFRGESSLSTYLTVVIAMLIRDEQVHRLGRWRPSAEARRQGRLATRLETLVERDGLPFRVAAEQLRSSGETTCSDSELARILASLPRRNRRPRETVMDQLPEAEGGLAADASLSAAEQIAEGQRLRSALASALEQLTFEDRLIVKLHFWEGMTIAGISRSLQLEQKPLYRRIERAVRLLRDKLRALGVHEHEWREAFSEPSTGDAAAIWLSASVSRVRNRVTGGHDG